MKRPSNTTPVSVAARIRPFSIRAATNPAAREETAPKTRPGKLHCEGKIEGGFGLMIVRPGGAQGQIQDGGDKDPRDQGGENSANRPEGRMSVGGPIGLRIYRGYCFHISLIVVL